LGRETGRLAPEKKRRSMNVKDENLRKDRPKKSTGGVSVFFGGEYKSNE